MEYYSSQERRPQDYLKTLDLSKCEDMVAPLPIPNRPNVIKLSIRAGDKLRDYFLDPVSEEEMTLWVTALAQVCGFCPGMFIKRVLGRSLSCSGVYCN